MLERFINRGYGDYVCSCCNTIVLHGYYHCVGEETDEEGYEWRGFCDECWKVLKKHSNKYLYNKYPGSLLAYENEEEV